MSSRKRRLGDNRVHVCVCMRASFISCTSLPTPNFKGTKTVSYTMDFVANRGTGERMVMDHAITKYGPLVSRDIDRFGGSLQAQGK